VATNRRKGILAFAQQSAVGSPASAPTYAVPFSTGGGPKPTREMADLPVTRPSSARSGQYIQRARGEGTCTILAHEEPVGLLLATAMGHEDFATVSGVPHHRFSMTEDLTDKPLTVWVNLATVWYRFPDTWVQLIGLAGNTGENVLVNCGFVSMHYEPNVAEPDWQSVFAPDVPRFKYIGSTIKLIAEGRTPGGPWTNVESVDAEIRRNPVLRYGPSLTPTVLVPIREVDLSATFTHDPDQLDWDFVTASATGSVTGEEESQNLAQGSVDITFGRHPADATKFIRVYSGPPIGTEGTGTYDTAPFSANWEFDAQLPDPDPGGGPIDINAAGRLIDPPEDPGESEVTVLLAGGKSSAYLT